MEIVFAHIDGHLESLEDFLTVSVNKEQSVIFADKESVETLISQKEFVWCIAKKLGISFVVGVDCGDKLRVVFCVCESVRVVKINSDQYQLRFSSNNILKSFLYFCFRTSGDEIFKKMFYIACNNPNKSFLDVDGDRQQDLDAFVERFNDTTFNFCVLR